MDNNDQAIYKALQDGPASIAEIAKATKLSKEDAQAEMDVWRKTRLYAEPVQEGKTEKWVLTDAARGALSASYGDDDGGSTDGSIKFVDTYERSDGTEG